MKQSDFDFGRKLGDEMLRSGIEVDARTYNAYLHVCVREGSHNAAKDALEGGAADETLATSW